MCCRVKVLNVRKKWQLVNLLIIASEPIDKTIEEPNRGRSLVIEELTGPLFIMNGGHVENRFYGDENNGSTLLHKIKNVHKLRIIRSKNS